MPNFQTSPWEEASSSVNALGQNFNNILVGLAQQRFQQEMARQQMALKMAELQQQGQLYQSHENLFGAQAGLYGDQAGNARSLAAINQAKLAAAQQFGTGARQQQAASMPPMDMMPTVANAGVLQDQRGQLDQTQAAAIIAALAGKPQEFGQYQTRSMANAATGPQMDPRLAQAILTGTKSAVPVAHEGGVYSPIEQLLTAVMPQNVAPGATLSPGTTQQPTVMGVPRTTATGNIPDWARAGQIRTGVGAALLPDDVQQILDNVIRSAGGTNQPGGMPLPTVHSKEDYIKLPKGAKYIGPDGKIATKMQ